MLREYCCEDVTTIERALVAGASRIELCRDLAVGGLTPSVEAIRQAQATCHEGGARLMVMVRPRAGDYAYDERELGAMERTIARARDLGADGVVFGCVRGAALDLPATRQLARAAHGLDRTFHMAFDEIASDAQPQALHALATCGIHRVLVHGGPLSRPIDQTLAQLKTLVENAPTNVDIMVGGGVTWSNAERIADALGVSQVHGTRIVRL